MDENQNEATEVAVIDGPMALTIEALMRGRLADPRALIGALSINADRVFLTFGDVGDHPRITYQVIGNELELISPREVLGEEEQEPAAPEGGEGAPAATGAVDPKAHTKDELLAMAAAAGIEISASATKAEIAAALNSAK